MGKRGQTRGAARRGGCEFQPQRSRWMIIAHGGEHRTNHVLSWCHLACRVIDPVHTPALPVAADLGGQAGARGPLTRSGRDPT